MADYFDARGAAIAAESAQGALETYMGQVEDGDRTADPSFVVGLAAVALCAHLQALTIRLDYLAHLPMKGGG